MDFEPAYNRFSLAQMGQRTAASGIDIVVCLMLSSLLEALLGIDVVSGGGELIFCFVWLFNRVLLTTKNQGQSVGRWSMNLRVVDTEFGKTANVIALLRREAAILVAMIIWIASLDSLTGAVILALVPIVIDIAPAFVDIDRRQAIHDKIGDTIVINSRKGFELERKLLSFFGQANKFVRTSQRTLQSRYGSDDDRAGYAEPQNRYATRPQRQRYGAPDIARRRSYQDNYDAPESYGQAYREEVEPMDNVDNYDRSGTYADGYDASEPWDDYADYGDPSADRYGQSDSEYSQSNDRYEARYEDRAAKARPTPNSSPNRRPDRAPENDWGDWDYDDRTINQSKTRDRSGRSNRNDYSQSPQDDASPRRRSERYDRSDRNRPNQRRSPRRRGDSW
jgi:uncharacterized RDD family membrane protein YckC